MQASSITTKIVRPGADRLLEDAPELIRGKRIGILTNHTGRLSDGRPLLDAIVESGLAKVAALFGPEHGVSGEAPDGSAVDHGLHPSLGIPVYSLYGKTHKPSPEMLADIDVLVCDIQDVGARFYTYISTIALALEAAAEQEKLFALLDRPNPIRGLHWDGPVRGIQLRSFVGWMPMPVTQGMTIGELARLWNEEKWLASGITARLEIVPMDGWKRGMWYDETGLPWIAPSPNIPRLSTAIVYPGICFFEGTSVSEGRGTETPFELIGAPWLDSEGVIRDVRSFDASGVDFEPQEFIPGEIPGVASRPKHEGERCRGIRIKITDRDAVQPVRLGLALLAAIKRSHPKEMVLRHRRFDILTGSSDVRKSLENNIDPEKISATWEADLKEFGRLRSKYLCYMD